MIQSKILIVDDADIIKTCSAVLNKQGYTACGVEDFEGAIDALSKSKFDVIFADMMLGEHTGIDPQGSKNPRAGEPGNHDHR